jgi:tagaturonate reductase
MECSDMNDLNRKTVPLKRYPEKILQIGEGNFLRCFIDWQIDILNEKNDLNAGIVIARRADTNTPPSLNEQDGLYTTLLRGYDDKGHLHNARRIISAVTREISICHDYDVFLSLARNQQLRFIISNTTEAGIVYSNEDCFDDNPPSTYPAKLTRLLYERYVYCDGSVTGGFILLPCELLDFNGEKLKEIVLQYIGLWGLEPEFQAWVMHANIFCSTLVDRIVSGFPEDEIEELTQEFGYRDQFMVIGEYFHFFAIQAPKQVGEELKLDCSDLNIAIVDDLKPYKERKIGILNGCHTALAPVSLLCHIELVKDATTNPLLEQYLEKLLEKEIIPSLELPSDDLWKFAREVITRFKNPYIEHKLRDISKNSMTKFKTRLLPQLLRYYENNKRVPPFITLALAATICFYRGKLDDMTYPLTDDELFLDMYQDLWFKIEPESFDLKTATEIARQVLGQNQHWETKLLSLDGLLEQTAENVLSIVTKGMQKTLSEQL